MGSTTTTEKRPDVRPQGAITASNADEFRVCLLENLAGGTKDLTIDLSAVDLIDSRGLSVFVQCYRSLASRGGTLTIRGANESLRGLFRVIQLDSHFKILD